MQEPPIPFRPGYELGSMVPIEEIENFKQEAELIAKLTHIETALRHSKQRLAEESARDREERVENIKKKIVEYEKRKDDIQDEIDNFKAPTTEKKTSKILFSESPVDWERTEIIVQPRSYESMKFHSTYVFTEHSSNEISDFLNQLSGSGSYCGFFVSANVVGTVTSRVHSAKSLTGSKGTLLIGAFATTKNVKTFKKLYLDPDKLKSLQDGKVHILTETIMGGVFIGMVHFKSDTDTKRVSSKNANEPIGQAGVSSGFHNFKTNLGNKKVSEDESINSITNTNIEIEFISYGTTPGFARSDVKYNVSEFKDLNPSNMKLSVEDEKDVKDMVARSGIFAPFSLDAKYEEAKEKQRLKQANAQMVLVNTLREMNTKEKTHKIHTLESLYDAYESFLENMKDKNAGVPIGFNYREFTKEEIEEFKNAGLTKKQLE